MKLILVVSGICMVVNRFLPVSILIIFFLLHHLIKTLFFLLKIEAGLETQMDNAKLRKSFEALLATVDNVIEQFETVQEDAQAIVESKLLEITKAKGISSDCPHIKKKLTRVAIDLTGDLVEQISDAFTSEPHFIDNTIEVLNYIHYIIMSFSSFTFVTNIDDEINQTKGSRRRRISNFVQTSLLRLILNPFDKVTSASLLHFIHCDSFLVQ